MIRTNIHSRSSIFLVVAGISASALFFVLGVFVGNAIPGPDLFSADTLSSWVTAVATVVITVLTFILAIETWRLRAAQAEQIADLRRESIQPNVSLALNSSPASIHFMDAKVTNNGKGIARNIRFTFLNRDGSPATIDSEPIIKTFKRLAMIDRGIESLGVGQELSSFVFSFLELSSEIGRDVFSPYLNVMINYEDVEGRIYTNSFAVDFVQYKGISRLGGSPLESISSEIKTFRQAFEKVSSSNRRLGIDVYSALDRKAETEELQALMDQQRRPQE